MMDIEKQRLILSLITGSRDLMALTSGILRPSYFDPELKKTVKFMMEYFEKYRDVPKRESVKVETGITLEEVGSISKADAAYVAAEVEEFCRNRAVTEAILKGPDLLSKGDFGNIISVLKDAISIGLQKDLGVNYFENPEERLRHTLINEAKISTGWPDLDTNIGGGVGRQEMIIFAANSGVGKSVTMLNCAKNLLAQGLNGVYITLEMSEGVVSKRLDSMISKISQDNLLREITKVAAEVEKAGGHMGKFVIKRMAENRTTVNDVRSYLQQLEQSSGFRPDFIVIDYLDIMGTTHVVSADNVFAKDKFVTEEVRSLGFDFDCVVITASQLGRCLDITSTVQLQSGDVVQIQHVKIGDKIRSNCGYVTVEAKTEIQKKKCFKITLEDGSHLIISEEHRMPVFSDDSTYTEKSIESGLKIGDTINTIDSSVAESVNMKMQKIIAIEEVGIIDVIDIQVSGNNLFYANNMLTHNSAVDADKLTHAHIQGGLSKIQTADYVVAIKQDDLMRASGEINFEVLKSRNSGGVGKKMILAWDPISLNITTINKHSQELKLSKKGDTAKWTSSKNQPGGVLGLLNT